MVDRLKSDFIANVSHELRTPLTSIKGYADLMMMGASGEMSEQQIQFMRVIRENTRRLNILVNDLLDISHIDAGQLALSFEPLDLIELAEKMLVDFRKRSKEVEKPMLFSLESPPSLPLVKGDLEKVRQVMRSLVSNSFSYTPANGKVIVRLSQKSDVLQVDVIDNGIGISEQNRERIFERFYRGEHPFVLATAGTGLGLAISKILIEMHGGKMWFESKGIPGEGSAFSFTLPMQAKG
jgi:signal transduction histidine kinase